MNAARVAVVTFVASPFVVMFTAALTLIGGR